MTEVSELASVYNGAPLAQMKTPSSTLVHVLIGKSILETLLVGAFALFGFMSIVPPYFHGWGEVTETSDFRLGGQQRRAVGKS